MVKRKQYKPKLKKVYKQTRTFLKSRKVKRVRTDVSRGFQRGFGGLSKALRTASTKMVRGHKRMISRPNVQKAKIQRIIAERNYYKNILIKQKRR